MESQKIEKGTIFLNTYTTLPTYVIYDHTHTARRGTNKVDFAVGYELVCLNGKLSLNKNMRYYKCLFNEKYFKKVGKVDIDSIIISAIRKEINKNRAITDRI